LRFSSQSVKKDNQIRLPFGDGKTSPIAADDVARAVAAILASPEQHIGNTYHLTGPRSENMDFYAQEYAQALDRPITYQDITDEPYAAAGATIGSAADAYGADVVLKVRAPNADERALCKPGTVVIGMLNPFDAENTAAMAAAGLQAFALEAVPRITRAQSMD